MAGHDELIHLRGNDENSPVRQHRPKGIRGRAGHLVHRPGRSQDRGCGTPMRYRSRHDPHRHRRNVWRCRARRSRGDRESARRGLSRLQGPAEQRVAPRHRCGLRAFAGAAEDRSARLLSPALARYPLAETVAAFEQLLADGKIRAWGVSNFDADDLDEILRVAGKGKIACNQVLYHLQERAIEHAVIPWCVKHGVAVVAYSPFGHNNFPSPRSKGGEVLETIAKRRGASPRQVALSFLTREPQVFAIPKAASAEHAADNAAAGQLTLSPDEFASLDKAFPRGAKPRSLPMI
jgi:hypothetical protein